MATRVDLEEVSTGGRAGMTSRSQDYEAEHFDFSEEKDLSMDCIEAISSGGEATIDQVQILDTYRGAPFVCVRRSYKFHPNGLAFQSLKDSYMKEIGILKKLKGQHHFIELLGSYTRNTANPNDLALVILQNPRANCDLASLLAKTPDDRQAIISDANLERGIACLASALCFLHGIRIRHKDIASKNILVHDNQLLFADFGLSIDFSELTNSETSGWFGQQCTYRPPEGDHYGKHTCATDVFSLGCVFFEILTTLPYANAKDPEEEKSNGKANLEGEEKFQDFQPYYKHLSQVYRGLENKRNMMVTAECKARDFWLKKTQQMLARPPGERPRMINICLELKQKFKSDPEHFVATACESCRNRIEALDRRLIDEPINVDFEEGFNDTALVNEDPATRPTSSESQQTLSHHISAWIPGFVKSCVIHSGIVKRWKLTFYLDNGRWLRMYGTRTTRYIDMKFDFGDLLIDRVVFEAGTFGNVVTLYKDKTEPEKHGFRSKPCDETFPGGITVWRYKITKDD